MKKQLVTALLAVSMTMGLTMSCQAADISADQYVSSSEEGKGHQHLLLER